MSIHWIPKKEWEKTVWWGQDLPSLLTMLILEAAWSLQPRYELGNMSSEKEIKLKSIVRVCNYLLIKFTFVLTCWKWLQIQVLKHCSFYVYIILSVKKNL